MCSSTTPSVPRTAPTAPPRAWRTICPPCPACSWRRNSTYLHDELENPERPFVVILGGAKVNDKIEVINRLLDKADTIIIGGGMAYTFRKLVQGITIGKSLYKPEWEPIAQAAIDKAKARGVKLLIPVDALITDAFDFDAKKLGNTKFTGVNESIPDGWEGVDIGPESVKLFADEIAKAKTVVWNGPMGVFEIKECATTLLHQDRGQGLGDGAAAARRRARPRTASSTRTGRRSTPWWPSTRTCRRCGCWRRSPGERRAIAAASTRCGGICARSGRRGGGSIRRCSTSRARPCRWIGATAAG